MSIMIPNSLENITLRKEKFPWTKCPFGALLLEASAPSKFSRHQYLLFEGYSLNHLQLQFLLRDGQ